MTHLDMLVDLLEVFIAAVVRGSMTAVVGPLEDPLIVWRSLNGLW